MSYDILICDPTTVPTTNPTDFLNWYDNATQYNEDRDYNTTEGTTHTLTAFFDDIRKHYPPMNGPYAIDEDELDDYFAHSPEPVFDDVITDYTIGTNFIYAAFAWSQADKAKQLAHTLATHHGLVFVDISETTTLHHPDGTTTPTQ